MNRLEVRNIMEDALNQQTNKLDPRVAQVTEEYFIGIIENVDSNHNM